MFLEKFPYRVKFYTKEGDGGGFAASFIRPPSAASRSLSTHKRQVLRATFSSSMLLAHPLPGGGWRAQRDGRGAAGWAAPRPGFIGFKRFRFLPPIPMCSSARDDTATVISTEAKRSGEISLRNVASPWWQEISRLCVSIDPRVFATIPTRLPLKWAQGSAAQSLVSP